ncbi:zinc finger BED domain-containing protein 5-like [Neoarius graeffei]|uniref:zinc finger BED domain-containing protein 5-like n=1 Tax=Neoarius graeffei TaxID=443677 RepID=UPI00298CE646|nr:zinc finger BED domain-containing protein 5-like [Neoarius graeffei]
MTVHKSYAKDFLAKSALRTEKVNNLRRQLAAKQAVFTRPVNKSKTATIASYRVSRVLAKHKKCFKDGEVFKEAFVEATDALFADFKNKKEIMSAIQETQLSRNTITRRCETMSEDIERQLRNDIESCLCFSLQFDESTDAVDVAQLCVFIRMVFHNMMAKEEILTILPLKGHTRGSDVFDTFMEFVSKSHLPLFKLTSITTDGAPSMVGHTAGFVALCKQSESFPDFLNYHCIIHQQGLCRKILNMKDVMDVAIKIACSFRARSLQRRLFRAQLKEAGADHTDLLLHTDVRWLSRGKFLERFLELLPEIKEFLKHTTTHAAAYTQLEDGQWLADLAFLTDVTNKINDLNLELQGKGKHIANMISSVNTFKTKLRLLVRRLQQCDVRNFPHLEAELRRQGKDSVELARYEQQIQNILLEFERRFTDFASIEPVAQFLCFPFGENVDVDCIAPKVATLFSLDSSAVENEILTLQNDIEIKCRATPGITGEFWNLLLEEKYPNLRQCALNMTSLFGSTYLCESAFSHMKIIKSKYRTTLTDDHLAACLRLALNSYCPDYEKLAASSQC